MTDLSPAAQAVLDAFVLGACGKTYDIHAGLAAALRAAADQVVPDEPKIPEGDLVQETCRWDERAGIRADILAIAAELDGKSNE